ncbi:MAG: hypothetical protein KBB11_07250 [Bacteroidales bacterium]|nr:hypothetical protein [Bacteroidales bacterium]HOY40134.1 hypothetical protein [Bacteroidales bacterium]HQP04514.1 hypothetical protein [Bacteroidales bacterium]
MDKPDIYCPQYSGVNLTKINYNTFKCNYCGCVILNSEMEEFSVKSKNMQFHINAKKSGRKGNYEIAMDDNAKKQFKKIILFVALGMLVVFLF